MVVFISKMVSSLNIRLIARGILGSPKRLLHAPSLTPRNPSRLSTFWGVMLFASAVRGSDPALQKFLREYDYVGARRYLIAQANSSENRNRPPEQQANLLCQLCEINHLLAIHSEAKDYGLQALEISKNLLDSTLITRIKLCIATTQVVNLENDNKLKYFQETQSYIQKRRDPRLTRLWHNRYGVFLMNFGELRKATPHLRKSYQISKKNGLGDGLMNDAVILALAYLVEGKLDSSYNLTYEAFEKASQKKDSLWIAKCHLSFAAYFMAKGKPQQEHIHLEKAKEISTVKGYSEFLGIVYSRLMRIALAAKKYNEVVRYGAEAEKKIEKTPYSFNKLYIDSLLYITHKKMGNPSKALIHLERFQSYITLAKQHDYESTIKENEYFQQLKEKNLIIHNQTLNLENHKKSRRILIVSNVLLIVTVGFLLLIQKISKYYTRTLYLKEKFVDQVLAISDKEDACTSEGTEDSGRTIKINRKQLYEEMLHLIEKKRLFLNPELTQKELITHLGTNKKYLYEAISQNSGENFKSLLNRLRVNEAKIIIREKVRNGQIELLGDVYLHAGFNSQASYYRLFKEFTGLTPKEYAKEFFRDSMK